MSDLYTVIAGIQPDQQDIVEAELLAKQILEANFPDLDLREGTGVRDLVLRPSSFLLAICKKGFDYYFAQNTIANVDDTTPPELVDNILSNLFLTRNLGSQAVINVRLYFARAKAVTLTTSTSFSTDGTTLFFPLISYTYPANSLILDLYQNEYYLDVDLLAADTGSQYNISTGSLLYFSNFDPYFLHGEINYLKQASTDPETNSIFISRASTAISTRNLINKPSIDNLLRQDFNYLNRIQVIGAGDAEIFRDQVEVAGSVGVGVTGTSMVLSDGDTTITVTLTDHGFLEDQLVDVVESGGGTPLVVKRQPISTVINQDSFKVVLPVTIAPRALLAPIVSAVEEDIFVHQGGAADIHCGEVLEEKRVQYTLDANGQCKVYGPVYKLEQSDVSEGPDPDTVTYPTAFTYSFSGYSTRADVTLVQGAGPDYVLTLTIPSHCLTVGRMVKTVGWPGNSYGADSYQIVTEIVDQDTVILGENLPNYVSQGALSTSYSIEFVAPSKDVGFSDRQELTLDFGIGEANEKVTMVLSQFVNLDSIQSYLDVPEHRVISADLLARGFDICILDIDLVVYDIVAPTTGEIYTIADNFLKTLLPGQEFILADLTSEITAKGISKLQTPIGIAYSYYTKDLFPVQTGTTTDVIKPLNSTTIFLVGDVQTSFTAV
jgi:hypothetical protein